MSDAFSNGPDPDAILKIRPDPTDFAEILNLDPENILASGPGRETRVFWDFNIFSLMLNGFTESYWRTSQCHTTPPGWSSSRTAQLTRFTQTSLNPNCLGAIEPRYAKISEKCPFFHHNNTDLIKQISLFYIALVMTNP